MMNTTDTIGFAAATLTTCAFVPQVLKISRSHSTKDISLPMLVTFITGVSLWLSYGFLVNASPIIIANLITLMLNLTILGFKLKYG
jgi:MtN3 and saliva related transmembrane protein